jgi:uncharacterized protein YjdB
MKNLLLLFALLLLSAKSFAQLYPIEGPATGCIGATTGMYDTVSGGTWTSSNTTVASIGSASGEIIPLSLGATTITYTQGGSYVTAAFSVIGSSPAAITGAASSCVGTTITLTDATPGGVWTSSDPGIASIGSASGLVTPAYGGSATINYTVAGCQVSTGFTVGSTSVGRITGSEGVCVGANITLADTTAGGNWISSNPAMAAVGSSSGIVTGLSDGYVIISYTVTGCGGPATDTFSVIVTSITNPGSISGATSDYVGAPTALSESVYDGSWSSSNPSLASVGSSTGIVTGISNGSATISYTVVGCSGAAYATAPMTISTINLISGTVSWDSGPDTLTGDTLKIWLITYNPSTYMLEASDSITTILTAASSYAYQFLGEPTDSYRVKAAVHPLVYAPYGPVPTYHTSSYYWHDANVFYHTGTADENIDINMIHGATSSGPGFISGSVLSGANRGASASIPAAGLLIFLLNSSGALAQQTYTDASGNYSFSSLATGSYTVYPELINYNTTAYAGINLSASASSVTNASFAQHTLSHTITPVNEGVASINPALPSIIL